LISESDLDIGGARAKSMSNKVFGHIGYIWRECGWWAPYAGIGAEAEFGMREGCCNGSSCCKTVSLSQWGFWVKGGISFN